jgi:hypothetical protein
MIRSRAIIARKNNEIVSLQNRLYQGEQSRINLDEKIAKIITQKESLTRRKELALKNEHYTNAEVLSSQIKELGVSLVQFQEEQDRTGGSALDIEKLDQEKEKLLALEKELESLEKTCGNLEGLHCYFLESI